jgi:hypothetical protein
MCIKIRNVLYAGPGFSEILKPEINVPPLENLQLEECRAPYLPEAFFTYFAFPGFHRLLNYLQDIEVSNHRPSSQTCTCRFEALLSLSPQAILAVSKFRIVPQMHGNFS